MFDPRRSTYASARHSCHLFSPQPLTYAARHTLYVLQAKSFYFVVLLAQVPASGVNTTTNVTVIVTDTNDHNPAVDGGPELSVELQENIQVFKWQILRSHLSSLFFFFLSPRLSIPHFLIPPPPSQERIAPWPSPRPKSSVHLSHLSSLQARPPFNRHHPLTPLLSILKRHASPLSISTFSSAGSLFAGIFLLPPLPS